MSMTLKKHGDDSQTIFEQDLDTEGCEPSSTAVPGSLINERPSPSIFREDTASVSPQQSMPRETVVTPVTIFFMATKLLNVIVKAARANPGETVCIPHTTATDLESFCWVIMYAVYRRTIDGSGLQAENSTAHAEITHEFARLFSATSIEGLAQSRRRRLSYGQGQGCYWGELGMEKLLEHMEQQCEPLAGLLLAVWRALWECASSDAGSKKKIPEERLQREKTQLTFLEEHGLPVKYTQRSNKPAIPTMVHRRLCLHIQLMLRELNQAS